MKNSFVYFDSAAAARPHPELLRWYEELLPFAFVNPHGGTCYAERARRILLDAERRLLALLGIRETEAFVIWTSGVTEALNLAVSAAHGIAVLDPGAHAALKEPLIRRMCSSMYSFTMDADGYIHPPECSQCDFAAFSLVNNEIGVVQKPELISCWLHGCTGRKIVLADGAQAFCKFPIAWESCIDMLALSSRKIGGPAGVGALVVRKGRAELAAQILGGGQQGGLRSGTCDVCGVECFVRTAESTMKRMAKADAHIADLRSCFWKFCKEYGAEWPGKAVGNGRHILMIALPERYEGAVVSRILAENYGIVISSASACSAEHGGSSTAMLAMGYSPMASRASIRISFDEQNTVDDVRMLVDSLHKTLTNY